MRFERSIAGWKAGLVIAATTVAFVAACTGGEGTDEPAAPAKSEAKVAPKADGGAAAAAKGAVTTASGLKYEVVEEGDGATPGPTDRVTVHYRGTLTDGTEFDSSYKRGQPAVFPVNRVIPGWTEALQLMQEGDKWKLTIPPQLAYGQRGAGRLIGPNETLLFEVELIEVSKAE